MHHNLEVKEELLFSPQIWTQAMMATLLISAAPVLILLIIPVHNAAQNKGLLNILLAFAMGGLLGDVFLHLLPHSFASTGHEHHHEHHEHHHDHEHEHHVHEEHNHEHEEHHHHEHHDHDHHEHEQHHDHVHEEHNHEHGDHHEHGHSIEGVMTGLWIITGIFIFLLVEKSIRNLTGGHGHSHSVQPEHETKQEKAKEGMRNRKQNKKENKGNAKKQESKDHQHVSKVSGFLNLAADFTHNFTDGLAIGATFVAGERMGMITTLAILLHEVPHEIGDFAILVSSGFTKWQAMKLQFVTAIGALIGTAVGITTGGLASASNVILPVTAGGFIYISTVSVIPELLEDCGSTKQTILELIAGMIGVALMTGVALME